MNILNKKWLCGLGLSLMFFGCGADDDTSKGSIDLSSVTAGPKSDIGKRAKIVEDLGPDSLVVGQFANNTRVYAYVFTASKGATIDIGLTTQTGTAASIDTSEKLDTILAVYGPYVSRQDPGEKLVEVDDEGDDVAAPGVKFEVPDEGTYMIAFSSWDTPGKSKYELKLECEGSDFQCRRPNLDKPCEDSKQFIQGGEITEDTEWNACETVVLETPTIADGATLTIRAGVEVKFNFLDDGNQFGVVGIDANGPLQVTGTKKHPVRLTSLKDGWRGLQLTGPGHIIQNAFIENAFVGITLTNASSGSFEDLILQNSGVSLGQGTGVLAAEGAQASFKRAVAKGFRVGFQSDLAQDVIIEDSTITECDIGVLANGTPSRNIVRCGNPPAPPNRPFRPDPIITHSDIFGNRIGIQVIGDQVLLQVEKTNIVNNKEFALDLQSAVLDADSFINTSNIINNAGATDVVPALQVRSYHRTGTLMLGGNFWSFISDPELSSNWQPACNGEIDFSGFEPELIADAGPRLDKLTDDVKQETWKVLQQQ